MWWTPVLPLPLNPDSLCHAQALLRQAVLDKGTQGVGKGSDEIQPELLAFSWEPQGCAYA